MKGGTIVLNMKERFKIIIGIIISFFTLFILSSCKDNNLYDKRIEEGYKITVRYESNGGSYLDREGVTLVDMFNPDDYIKDETGTIHIKLTEPTDPRRPSGGSEGIYITRTNYFLVGWYKNKTIRTNDLGKVVDEDGNPLLLKDNKYYLESDPETQGIPAYDYSGYWDFENDTIDYKDSNGIVELTLYAVWSKYFEFDYYYKDGTEWKYLSNTKFDYKTTNQEGSLTSDKDTIFLPTWVDGAMNYTHKYENNSTYTFPKVNGYTFKEAYLDEDLTNKITGSYEHTGSIDYETGKAVNPVVNIYITLDEGEYYHINNATELVNNPNLNGIYIIENDLDFSGLEWPTVFSLGTFNGKMYSKDDNNYKLSNIEVYHSSDSAKVGGIFGKISENAEIKNLEFENASLDIAYIGRRNRDTSFGLFSGIIENKDSITNVKLSGEIKIGPITLDGEYEMNLIATQDNNDNITTTDTIHLSIYGIDQGDQFSYTINPDTVEIDELLNISVESVIGLKKPNEKYVIQ